MSVVIETTLGDITVDLYLDERPRTCLNFLKLCKIKYYNYNLFHTVSRGFIAQTGDPTGSRTGGESMFGIIDGPLKRFFESEKEPRIKHTKMGLISFVGNEEQMCGSQFFITLGEGLTYLDEKHCVFGEVVEGFETLEIINEAICDKDDRPYQDIRITHTVVLDDPYPNPPRLRIPSRSPSPSAERLQGGRIAPDEDIDETHGKTLQEISEIVADREAKARATILEMVGDIPDADVAPPENVLFVCKLNPVTTDDDLEIIFSRFGKINSCEVIRDRKTGDSLQYAFVEFDEQKSCEDAYFKMDNVLIDDRRIHVDFSQSVSKVKWLGKGRGVKTFDKKDNKNIGNGDYKRKNGNNRQKSKSPTYRKRSPENSRSRNKTNSSPKRENKDRSRSRSHDSRKRDRNRSNYSPKRGNEDRSRSRSYDSRKQGGSRSRNNYSSNRYNEKPRSPVRNRDRYSPKRSRNDRAYDRREEYGRYYRQEEQNAYRGRTDGSRSMEYKRSNDRYRPPVDRRDSSREEFGKSYDKPKKRSITPESKKSIKKVTRKKRESSSSEEDSSSSSSDHDSSDSQVRKRSKKKKDASSSSDSDDDRTVSKKKKRKRSRSSDSSSSDDDEKRTKKKKSKKSKVQNKSKKKYKNRDSSSSSDSSTDYESRRKQSKSKKKKK